MPFSWSQGRRRLLPPLLDVIGLSAALLLPPHHAGKVDSQTSQPVGKRAMQVPCRGQDKRCTRSFYALGSFYLTGRGGSEVGGRERHVRGFSYSYLVRCGHKNLSDSTDRVVLLPIYTIHVRKTRRGRVSARWGGGGIRRKKRESCRIMLTCWVDWCNGVLMSCLEKRFLGPPAVGPALPAPA